MSADQAPAADPTPGSSRVDVAGLRAAAEAATPGPWERRIAPREGYDLDAKAEYMRGTAADNGRPLHVLIAESTNPDLAYIVPALTGDGPNSEANAAYIAAADPTTVLALLDERDDLAARLATAEAAVERLTGSVVALVRAHGEALLERNEAERQVQAVRDLARQVDVLYPPKFKFGAEGNYVAGYRAAQADIRAALAPLDPDAPAGHDGHGAPDTHQGDTEAGDGR